MQASVLPLGGNRRMPVFGWLNDRGVESYEVEERGNEMKGEKALGLDQCIVKFLRKGGRSMVAWLVRLFNCCFVTGRVPWDWCRACIDPLYWRKGDRFECSNLRGISLSSAVGKLNRRVLISRIVNRTDGD